jgi:hypothetical protein
MKPKEQKITVTNSYTEYLPEWINALSKLAFSKGHHFKASKTTEATVLKKVKGRIAIDSDCFKELTDYPGGQKVLFIQEIMPFVAREEFDGIWITFEENNIAYFGDMDYGHFKEYLKENGIEENKKMTWQEAYDKLCDLCRKEKNAIPKLNS